MRREQQRRHDDYFVLAESSRGHRVGEVASRSEQSSTCAHGRK
jgi:hypothetical protein